MSYSRSSVTQFNLLFIATLVDYLIIVLRPHIRPTKKESDFNLTLDVTKPGQTIIIPKS